MPPSRRQSSRRCLSLNTSNTSTPLITHHQVCKAFYFHSFTITRPFTIDLSLCYTLFYLQSLIVHRTSIMISDANESRNVPPDSKATQLLQLTSHSWLTSWRQNGTRSRQNKPIQSQQSRHASLHENILDNQIFKSQGKRSLSKTGQTTRFKNIMTPWITPNTCVKIGKIIFICS